MVDGHPGETSGWPGCMDKRHDILRKASPRLKETEDTSSSEAYLCNRKSLWALAWLTLVVTLAGKVLADVELW